jgi:hypothetical protein
MANASRLARVVDATLAVHGGGSAFFDALDASLRSRCFLQLLVDWSGERSPNVVVSGRFGRWFRRYNPRRARDVLLLRGGIGGSNEPVLRPLPERVEGRQYVFYDDSLYSGATRRTVASALARAGGTLVRTYVLYDGSLQPDPAVTGMFRYHTTR